MKPINISLCLSNLALSQCQNTLSDLAVLLNSISIENLEYQAELVSEANHCLKRGNKDGLAAILKCWEYAISEQGKITEHAQYLRDTLRQDLKLAYKAPPISDHSPRNDNRLLCASQ